MSGRLRPSRTNGPQAASSAELAAQLAEEKRRRREEVAALETALAAAHGELLELRPPRRSPSLRVTPTIPSLALALA